METIKIKETCNGFNVNLSLAHPLASPGPIDGNRGFIYEVTAIPPGVLVSQVVRLFRYTTILDSSRFSVPFSVLGLGCIVR